MLRFKRPLNRNPDVVGLFGAQARQGGAQFGQVQAGYLFIQLLGKPVDAHGPCIAPQIDLGQGLIGE